MSSSPAPAYEAIAYLDAIRLARSLAADATTRDSVLDELLNAAPLGDIGDARPSRILVDACHTTGATFNSYTSYKRWPPDPLDLTIGLAFVAGLIFLLLR